MGSDPASLPREPDQLIEMVVSLQDENDKLRAIVETLKRTLFGARSERLAVPAAQLPLGLGDLAAIPIEPQPAQKPRPADRPARPKPVRNIGGLPQHLPREEIVIEPEAHACPCCQGKLHPIGEDISEMLDVIPAVIRVKRIRRPRYGCRACESAVVQAHRTTPSGRRRTADGRATRAHCRFEVCVALAVASPGADAGRLRHQPRPFHAGALDCEDGVVAAAAAYAALADRDVGTEGVL